MANHYGLLEIAHHVIIGISGHLCDYRYFVNGALI
jgi:hypothetical protein